MSTYAFLDFSDRYPALAIITAAFTLFAAVLFYFTGRIRQINKYLIQFQILQTSPILMKIAAVIYYILIIVPTALLIVWVILMLANTGSNPGLPILFYGLFIQLAILPCTDQLYYFKLGGLGLLFIVAQLLSLFLSPLWSGLPYYSFFGISAVLLILNGIFVSLSLWLVDGKHWDLEECILHVKEQFIKICPLWNSESPPLLLTGGIYCAIAKSKWKTLFVFALYFLSLLCLLAESLIVYYATDLGILGIVTSIAVVSTDLLVYMITKLDQDTIVSPNVISILVMMIRICLFGFSAEYWFMGYCLLYLLLMTFIYYLIIDKMYPNFENIPTAEIRKTNIFKTPEFIGLFATLLFSAIIYYLGNQTQLEIPVLTIQIGVTSYPFWAIGVGSIILSLATFFYIGSLRILQRKRNRIREYNSCYLGTSKLSDYYVFWLGFYLLLIIFGFYFWVTVGNPIIWLTTVFIPPIFQTFLIFLRNWTQNDYQLLGDVQKYNMKYLKLQQAQELMLKKKNEVLDKLKKDTKYGKFFDAPKITESKVKETQQLIINNNNNNNGSKQDNPDTSDIILIRKVQEDEVSDLVELTNEKKIETFQPIDDWKLRFSFLEALREGKLLPTDKKILWTVPLMIALLLVFSLICFFVYDHNTMAFTISTELLVMFLTLLPMKRYFSTLIPPNLLEIIMFALGVVLNFAFGGIGLAIGWRSEQVWVIWWAFGNPIIFTGYALWGLLTDHGASLGSFICSIVLLLEGLGMGIFVLILLNVAAGVAIIGVSLYTGYFLGIYLYYLKYNQSLPRFIVAITGIIVILNALAVMIVSFILDSFNDFTGFSITYLVLNLIGFGFSYYLLRNDLETQVQAPNYYSPYGTLVFKYQASLQSCKKNPFPLFGMYASLFGLLVYALLFQIFVYPVQVGVSLTCVFELLIFLAWTYFTTYNTYHAGKVANSINQTVIKAAWTEEKQIQEKLKNIDPNEGSLMKQLQDHLKTCETSYQNETDNTKKLILLKDISDTEEKIERNLEEQLLVGVNLWVRTLMKVQGAQKKVMLKLINFVSSSQEMLGSLGIVILVEMMVDLESKYNKIVRDYNLLSAQQKIKFDFLFRDWVKDREEKERLAEECSKKEEEMKRLRDQELLKKLQEADKQTDDSDKPIDKMRDSPAKLKKIADAFKGNNLYVDVDFKMDKTLLPAQVRDMCKGFKRPPVGSFTMDDSDTYMDVHQGALGDCYLISAIGVLGKKLCGQLLGIGIWQNPAGCYMVKFRKMNRDLYVIVDDQFPVDGQGDWLLAKSQNANELYVNIIEKAYAKLYGSFEKIQGGKVHLTLSELTGGFPEEIKLTKYQETGTNDLFEKMLTYYKAGYLLGAGSPQNAKGDQAIIEGIVQGHAYYILRVANLDGNRLIKLRNPHGNQGSEWVGDWSDKSEKWTQKMVTLAGEKFGDDGAFWMSIDDFVYCFKSLMVCKIFDSNKWKTQIVSGKWQGPSAAGLPNRQNMNPRIRDNPHYGIKVYKKTTIFLELKQNETLSSWKGKNFIYFMVQKNGGKRITTTSSIELMVGKPDSATNTASISAEMELQAPTYPYVFSVVVACINTGDTGSFNLVICSNTDDTEIIDDSEFDR